MVAQFEDCRLLQAVRDGNVIPEDALRFRRVGLNESLAKSPRAVFLLRNTIGKLPSKFEETDYSFSTHPHTCPKLEPAKDGIECLFVRYWPKLRDSKVSNKWRDDMIGALVIRRKLRYANNQ
jgi:hypothetical protein